MAKAIKFLVEASKLETNECIPWPYAKTKGYGVLTFEGKTRTAHTLMLRLFGPAPKSDKHVDAAHLPVVCHNRACVNLRHLYWATRKENAADRVKDRVQIGRPARLTAKDVAEIIKLYNNGLTQREIGLEFGIARQHVSRLVRKERSG